MKTKKILSFIFSLGVLTFPMFAFAADWGVGYNTATGGVNVGVGSNGSGAGAVWGGGNYMMGGGWALSNPYGLPQGSILGIASNLLFWLLALFAILGVVGFVISGIMYLLSGANEDLAKKGKSGMTASIIGIIVGLSGFVIMQAVASFLTGTSKTF